MGEYWNANMQFVHTELVQVFCDIKWISSETFEFEKKTKKTPYTIKCCGFVQVWFSFI
jgi:hypothetical protein